MSAGGDTRIKSKDGETYIAATQRPDGTWRKPRRVKEGYIPQDEQPKFECSAQKALRDQTGGLKYPVGLSPLELQKKVQARQQKPETSKAPVAAIVKPNAPITPKDHFQKKINNLQKKLDEIEKLKEKIDNGELKNPEKTQLQKIERRHEIESEMEKLIQEMEQL